MDVEITNTPATGGTNIGESTSKERATSSEAKVQDMVAMPATAEQTPEQVARTKAYDAEKLAQDAKARFWNTCTVIAKIAGSFVGVGVTLLGIFYAYKINSISEPIGGIKADIANLKEDNQRTEKGIDLLASQINSLKDILIGKTK